MKRLKEFKALVEVLIEEGYRPDSNGDWRVKNTSGPTFYGESFAYCGEEMPWEDSEEYNESWVDTTIEYPCVMQSTISDIIVYFLKADHGIVVSGGAEEERNVGDLCSTWDMDLFELWAEVVKVAE